MELQKVSCNNCGNLLEINHSTKFVTCNSCNSILEVVKTENSYFTKDRDADRKTELLGSSKPVFGKSNSRVYSEIEMLDREWNNNLPNFMVKGTLPDTDGMLTSFMGIFVIIFGIIWTIVASSMSGAFGLFGVVFVIAGIWNLFNHNDRRSKFLEAKNEYETKRTELQSRLEN